MEIQVFRAKLIRRGMINIVRNSKISTTHILYELAEGFVCVSRWRINGLMVQGQLQRHHSLKYLSTIARGNPKVTSKYIDHTQTQALLVGTGKPGGSITWFIERDCVGQLWNGRNRETKHLIQRQSVKGNVSKQFRLKESVGFVALLKC